MSEYKLYVEGRNIKNPGLSSTYFTITEDTVEKFREMKDVGYMSRDAATIRAIIAGLLTLTGSTAISTRDTVKVILSSMKLVKILQGTLENKDKKLTVLLSQIEGLKNNFKEVIFSSDKITENPPKKKVTRRKRRKKSVK
jgi:hypothetical protein